MAITIVQISPKGEGNNVASASASFTALPTAGNAVLVCAVIKRDPGHANSSCTDNQGNTYAKQIQFVDAKNQAEIWADFEIGTPSGTYTVTLAGNYNSGNYIALYLVEVSGLVTTGVLDQSATGTTAFPGTSTSVGPTSATDTADELVMAVISFESTDSNLNITLPTGYTAIGVEQSSVGKAAIEACYKLVSATGTQSATWNHDGTANTGAVLATFRAATGGGASSVIDTLAPSETFLKRVDKRLSDAVALTEARALATLKRTAETVGLSEGFTALTVVVRALADSVSLAETVAKRANKVLAETVALSEARALAVSKRTAETVGLTEGFSALRVLVRSVSDTLGLTEADSLQAQKRNAEAVALAEAIALAASKRLNESAGLTEGLGAQVVPGGTPTTTLPPLALSMSIGIRIG